MSSPAIDRPKARENWIRTSTPPGNTPPVVIFLHGFLDEGNLWNSVIDALENNGLPAVALDLPGMGSRASDTGPYTLARMTDIVVEFIDRMSTPVVLVGHSMGTQPAELVAIARPATVIGIALLAPIPLDGITLPPEISVEMRALGANRIGQTALRTQLAVTLTDPTLDNLLDIGMKVSPGVAAELFDAWTNGDPTGDAPTIFTGSVLIAGGEGDGFVTPDFLRTVIAPRFPQADLRFVTAAGHWPHVEQPQATADILIAFLTQLANRTDIQADHSATAD